MSKRVLIIGSGAREGAIELSLLRSGFSESVFIAPGNGGSGSIAMKSPVRLTDYAALARSLRPDLTIVGPDNPLADGVVDLFRDHGWPIIGPTMEAAQLESSKIFAKRAMKRWGVPTAGFRAFASLDAAVDFLERQPEGKPWVIKADGLCLGKGVVVAANRNEAIEAVRDTVAEYGERIVIEEKLEGIECSYTVFVRPDGDAIALPSAVDYKRLKAGDHEPMTGGMGCYAPHPGISERLKWDIVLEIVKPTLEGLAREKIYYAGFLYFGLMLTNHGPRLLEYNVRLGDPEATVILPILRKDFWLRAYENRYSGGDLAMDVYERGSIYGSIGAGISGKRAVSVVLASEYYPSSKHEPKPIFGIEKAKQCAVDVLHAATKMVDGQLMTNGGRVLTVVGTGVTYAEARAKAYAGASKIQYDGMQYRDDIAKGVPG